MMQIEHVELQSEAPERINDYSNCRYICKYCNQSRGAHPARTDEDKLLDPCNNTWSDYFCLSDDKLEIKEKTNGNAQKTKDVYDLNDSRKTTRRKERRRRLSELIQVIQEGPALRDQLQREAEEYAGNAPGKAREKLEQAKTVDKRIRYSKREIQRYRIKPDDSPEDCKCDRNLKLPAFLLDQSKEIEL